MWAWGFFLQRLLPSVVVMVTTYAIVLAVIGLFRVKSRNGRIALFLLPMYKSLATLVLGVPRVTAAELTPIYIGMKLPDIDQLPFRQGSTPDLFFAGSGIDVVPVYEATWVSAFNWVLGLLVIAAVIIVIYRLARFAAFYRRLSTGRDVARDESMRGAAQRAATAMSLPVPKVVAIDTRESFVPFTMGWRRPVVVLPQKLLDPALLPDAELESVLAHEFAHIKRRDYLLNWIFSVVDTLLFFNPLTKRVVSRAYEAAEEACDGLAARTTRRASALVDALVRIAHETSQAGGGVRRIDSRLVAASVQSYTNTLMSGRHLKDRIVRLETGEAEKLAPRWIRAVKTVPLALFVALFAYTQFNLGFPIGGGYFLLQ